MWGGSLMTRISLCIMDVLCLLYSLADPRAVLYFFFAKEPVPPLLCTREPEVITSVQIYWVSAHCCVEEHELGIQRCIENGFQMKCLGEGKGLPWGCGLWQMWFWSWIC